MNVDNKIVVHKSNIMGRAYKTAHADIVRLVYNIDADNTKVVYCFKHELRLATNQEIFVMKMKGLYI